MMARFLVFVGLVNLALGASGLWMQGMFISNFMVMLSGAMLVTANVETRK